MKTKEDRAAYFRNYLEKNRAKARDRHMKWRMANRDKLRELKKEYHSKNKESELGKRRVRYRKNRKIEIEKATERKALNKSALRFFQTLAAVSEINKITQ
jgi:hypothetical protein